MTDQNRKYSRQRLVLWLIGTIGGLLIFLAQVPPEHAAHSLAAWAKLLGLENAAWLRSPITDSYATVVGLILASVSLLILMSALMHRRRHRTLALTKAGESQLQLARELEACVRRGQAILASSRSILVTQVEAWLEEARPLVARCSESERSMFETIVPFPPGSLSEDARPQLEIYVQKLRLIMGRAFDRTHHLEDPR